MKVSDQFILRTIADEHLVIPTGEAAVHVKGLIALSESGVLLYNKLQEDCSKDTLVNLLLTEYEVTEDEAQKDVESFLNQMKQLDMLVENSQ